MKPRLFSSIPQHTRDTSSDNASDVYLDRILHSAHFERSFVTCGIFLSRGDAYWNCWWMNHAGFIRWYFGLGLSRSPLFWDNFFRRFRSMVWVDTNFWHAFHRMRWGWFNGKRGRPARINPKLSNERGIAYVVYLSNLDFQPIQDRMILRVWSSKKANRDQIIPSQVAKFAPKIYTIILFDSRDEQSHLPYTKAIQSKE